MLRHKPLPTTATEAHYFVEMGTTPSATELDNMPQLLVDKILIYKAVKRVVENGGTLPL
jgi:hypothetical protein